MKYYLMVIEHGNTDAMYNLVNFYRLQGNINLMVKYLTMVADNGDIDAMHELADHYQELEQYDNQTQYYLMAIQKGDSEAMYKLGEFYELQRKHQKKLYYYIEDYGNMIKYLLMDFYHTQQNHRHLCEAYILVEKYILNDKVIDYILNIYFRIQNKKKQLEFIQ